LKNKIPFKNSLESNKKRKKVKQLIKWDERLF
jgi:hypothetical protein